MAEEGNASPAEEYVEMIARETYAFLAEFEQLFNEAKATARVRGEIFARWRKIKVLTIACLVFRLMVICMFGV